jgi:hypothetical protein
MATAPAPPAILRSAHGAADAPHAQGTSPAHRAPHATPVPCLAGSARPEDAGTGPVARRRQSEAVSGNRRTSAPAQPAIEPPPVESPAPRGRIEGSDAHRASCPRPRAPQPAPVDAPGQAAHAQARSGPDAWSSMEPCERWPRGHHEAMIPHHRWPRPFFRRIAVGLAPLRRRPSSAARSAGCRHVAGTPPRPACPRDRAP